MTFKYINTYIVDAIVWLNDMYSYSNAPDVDICVMNGHTSITGDGETFGFAAYVPSRGDGDTPHIYIAGNTPDEIYDDTDDRIAAELDFYVGNLFHEVAHHFQFSGFRLVDKESIEVDAEQFAEELLALYKSKSESAIHSAECRETIAPIH